MPSNRISWSNIHWRVWGHLFLVPGFQWVSPLSTPDFPGLFFPRYVCTSKPETETCRRKNPGRTTKPAGRMFLPFPKSWKIFRFCPILKIGERERCLSNWRRRCYKTFFFFVASLSPAVQIFWARPEPTQCSSFYYNVIIWGRIHNFFFILYRWAKKAIVFVPVSISSLRYVCE